MIWTILFLALALFFAYLALRVRSGNGDRVILAYLAAPRQRLRQMNKKRLCSFLWKIHAILAGSMVIGLFHGALGSGAIWLSIGLALLTWSVGICWVNFRPGFRK